MLIFQNRRRNPCKRPSFAKFLRQGQILARIGTKWSVSANLWRYPQNSESIPAVKIFVFPELKQDWTCFKRLKAMARWGRRGAEGGSRTPTGVHPPDPEPGASTSSATSALGNNKKDWFYLRDTLNRKFLLGCQEAVAKTHFRFI